MFVVFNVVIEVHKVMVLVNFAVSDVKYGIIKRTYFNVQVLRIFAFTYGYFTV